MRTREEVMDDVKDREIYYRATEFIVEVLLDIRDQNATMQTELRTLMDRLSPPDITSHG